MSYAGYYINLDRSSERRERMEAQLRRFGLEEIYRRFPAADGNALGFRSGGITDGEMGCFTSHFALLRDAAGAAAHVHVMEDDAVMCDVTRWTIDQLIRSGTLGRHDLIFTHSGVAPSDVVDYKRLYESVNIVRGATGKIMSLELRQVEYRTSTSSYIVNARSIPKIVGLLEEVLKEGPIRPIDLTFRNLMRQGKLKATCMFPFVTSIWLDSRSQIDGRGSNDASRLAMDIVRRAFFVDRDLDQLLAEALGQVDCDQSDSFAKLLGHCLQFSMTRRYAPF